MARFDLRNKTIVITGGASGIGYALAHAFAARGANLALVDRDASGLRSVCSELTNQGTKTSAHLVDLADRAAIERLPAEITKEHGAVDVLVNNAGLTVVGDFEHLTEEQIDRQVTVNLLAAIHGCRVFLPLLRERPRAHIVNTSSMAGLVGMPWQSVYCATKSALRGFSQSLRAELSGTTLGVTAVLPGTTRTRIMSNAEHHHPTLTANLGQILETRGPKPSRLAGQVVRAVERNRAEVFGGVDSRLLDWSARACPWLVRWLMGRIGREGRRRTPKASPKASPKAAPAVSTTAPELPK